MMNLKVSKKTIEKDETFNSIIQYLIISFKGKDPLLELDYAQADNYLSFFHENFLDGLYKCLPKLTCLRYPAVLLSLVRHDNDLSILTKVKFPHCKIEKVFDRFPPLNL